MEGFKTFQLIAISIALSVISATGQISTPCTNSMISSFTPCLNFVTGSSSNASMTPTGSCCSSLKSLMSTSMDCACLIITASVPVQLPINRTLAINLPRACKMNGVPVQCKASGTPLPAPGSVPFLLAPTLPPTASPLSPQASKAAAAGPAPESDETPLDLAPTSPPVEAVAPNSNTGIRPVLTQPSASNPSFVTPPSMLILFVGILFFIFH